MATGEKGGGRSAAGLPSGVVADVEEGDGEEGRAEGVPRRCPGSLRHAGLFFCLSAVRVMRNGSFER